MLLKLMMVLFCTLILAKYPRSCNCWREVGTTVGVMVCPIVIIVIVVIVLLCWIWWR